MSFCVVPASLDDVVAVLFGQCLVHAEQPHRGGVDRHRRVHRLERELVEEHPHLAEVGHRHADLADLAPGEDVVGVVAGLRGEVEGDREAGLALRQVVAVQLVRRPRRGVTRVRAHHPRSVGHGTILPHPRDRPNGRARCYFGVVVEADAVLPAEAVGGHHAAQQQCGCEVRVAELLMERVEDREAGVEADEVEQLERAHREVAAALHRGVDVVATGDAGVVELHRVVEVGEQERVHDEAGLVFDVDAGLAARLDERPRPRSSSRPTW